MIRRFALSLACLTTLTALPSVASACALRGPIAEGTYVNTDPNARTVRSLRVWASCGSYRENSDGTVTSSAHGNEHWRVRARGDCGSNTVCDWADGRASFAQGGQALQALLVHGLTYRTVTIMHHSSQMIRVQTVTTYASGHAVQISNETLRRR